MTQSIRPNLSAQTFTKSLLIRESHLDTFGHVNNSKYLEIFEDARWDIVEAGGYGLSRVRELQLGPVVLEIKIRFAKELRLRETVTVQTICDPYKGGKIMGMTQTILNAADEVCCEAKFVFGLFDLRTRKLVTPTAEWCRAIGYEVP